MSNDHELIEPTPEELAELSDLLARPDVWDEPPAGLEDAIVAAIATEASRAPLASPPVAPEAEPTSLDERRARRARSAAPWWLGAAAAAVLVVGGIALFGRGGDDDEPAFAGDLVELSPSDAAAGASASAAVTATPAGLKIVLDVDDLPGAPEGFFYEAWLSDGETRVSAGTFHLREGDNPIALWAGVADPAFNKLSVTLEPLDGDAASSGDVRFTGEFDFDAAVPPATD